MNDNDKNNLVFLMNLSPQAFRDWFAQASIDDIDYAEELITQAQILAVDARVAQLPQYKEAEEVLKPYML
jgi:deoxyribodipyrimidine photolyase-like uncharacterized protein